MNATTTRTPNVNGNITFALEFTIRAERITNAALKLVLSDKARQEYSSPGIARRVWNGRPDHDVPFDIVLKGDSHCYELSILFKPRLSEPVKTVFHASIEYEQITNITINLIEETGISTITKAADELEVPVENHSPAEVPLRPSEPPCQTS